MRWRKSLFQSPHFGPYVSYCNFLGTHQLFVSGFEHLWCKMTMPRTKPDPHASNHHPRDRGLQILVWIGIAQVRCISGVHYPRRMKPSSNEHCDFINSYRILSKSYHFLHQFTKISWVDTWYHVFCINLYVVINSSKFHELLKKWSFYAIIYQNFINESMEQDFIYLFIMNHLSQICTWIHQYCMNLNMKTFLKIMNPWETYARYVIFMKFYVNLFTNRCNFWISIL